MHTTTSRPASGTEASEPVDYAAQHEHHRATAIEFSALAGEEGDSAWGLVNAARGQMHATLALAAATMLNAQRNAPTEIVTLDVLGDAR